MKMNKVALVLALAMAANSSYAGFVDNRGTDAVIDVNYKSITLEDLVADIVPRGVQIDYASADLRKKLVTISGKGTWPQLLAQASSKSALAIVVERNGQRVTVGEVTKSASGNASAAMPRAAATTQATDVPQKPAAAPVPEKAWDIRLTDKTIFGAMKRWSKTAGWQLMWDTEGNDFPVIAEATYKGEFDLAVEGVMASLQKSQYPLRACLYDNRAVRIIHKTKRCEG